MEHDLSSMKDSILNAMITAQQDRWRNIQIWDAIYHGLTLPDEDFDAMAQCYDMALEVLLEDGDVVMHGDGRFSLPM